VTRSSTLVSQNRQYAMLEVHILPPSTILLTVAHSGVERQIKLRQALRKPFDNYSAELLFLFDSQDSSALVVLNLVRDESGRIFFCPAVADGETVGK
jgi:hypothetical protein